MNNLNMFFKGIVVGIGGIAPGLSGSVLMVILGLYEKVINIIANIFKDIKKNILFLLPIGIGMLVGIVLFSRLIDYTLLNFEIQTRLAFFGLLIGTIPLFYKEVTKEKKLDKYNFLMMLMALVIGLVLFTFNGSIKAVTDMNIFQSFLLGFVGISATIIPGIDGASILSALGMYGNWLELTSLSNINLAIYIPAGIGVVFGALFLSKLISTLLKKNYTATFSVLFGFFLSVIPSVLKMDSGSFISLGNNTSTYVGIVLFIVCIIFSYFFSKINQEDK